MATYPHYMHAVKNGPDSLVVTSDLGGVKRTAEIRRHELEAMAWELGYPDGRSFQIIDGVRLDENDVYNLLADLG